jgi:hypothetical protein
MIGEPARQVDPELVDFPDLIRVKTTDDALRAVHMITEQGEGVDSAHADCHFAIFREIRRQYLMELAQAEPAETEGIQVALTDPAYRPVRPAIANPVAGDRPELGAVGANPITDELTMQVAGLFDSIYGHMLRMLQHVFDNATSHHHLLSVFGHGAIELMTTVLKPLGEALTRMPAGEQYEDQTAGPGFALARHVPLPTEPTPASIVAAERFRELSTDLCELAATPHAVAQLTSAAANLEQLAARFARLPQEIREG